MCDLNSFSINGFIIKRKLLNDFEIGEILSQVNLIQASSKIKNLHLSNTNFLKLVCKTNITDCLKLLYSSSYYCIQLSYDKKPPDSKGHKLHTDNFFICPNKGIVIAVYIALEDSNIDNGCTYVIPKSHDIPFENKTLDYYLNSKITFEDELLLNQTNNIKPLLLKKGDVVFWNGDLVHGSAKNVSPKTRKSIICHFISEKAHSISAAYLPVLDCDGNKVFSILGT